MYNSITIIDTDTITRRVQRKHDEINDNMEVLQVVFSGYSGFLHQ